jgi:hypothetical protein
MSGRRSVRFKERLKKLAKHKTVDKPCVTTFQSLALIGIFLVVLGALVVAWEVEKLRREVRKANGLPRKLLITMRDRL